MLHARGTGAPRHRGTERGFTLIEVIVALAIGSAVVLMVHQAFGSVIDLSGRLDEDRAAHAQRMHAREVLETVFGSLEIGFPGTTGFEGLPDRVAFSIAPSAVDDNRDTRAPGHRIRAVSLSVEGGWLTLRRTRMPPDSLVAAASVAFDYLLSYGAQSSWVKGWHSPASAPLAVRMRVLHTDAPADTLFFIIGPRG